MFNNREHYFQAQNDPLFVNKTNKTNAFDSEGRYRSI